MDSLQDLINEMELMANTLDEVIMEVAGEAAEWRAQHPDSNIEGERNYTIHSNELIAVSGVRENLNSLLMHFEENRYVLQPENPED